MDRLEVLNRDIKLIKKARTFYRGAKVLTSVFFTAACVIVGKDILRFIKKKI